MSGELMQDAMGIIAKIAGVVLFITFMTFVAFFGRIPALRRTPIAWLHKAIWNYIPNGVLALDRAVTGGRFTSSMSHFGNYMLYDKHPTVLAFFFLLLSVSQYLSVPPAWPLLTPIHKLLLPLAILAPYIFLYLSVYTDPGSITPSNLTHNLSRYPYDFTLYHPGATCRTCNLLKPARSKHCSVCKACIARCDHHCIFINNCVGAGNMHWFLLLLLSTGVLALYGGCLGVGIIADKIAAKNPAFAIAPWRTELRTDELILLWTWGMQSRVGIGGVAMLALLCSPLVWGLLSFNLWNVWSGVTTNETMKWSDWGAEMSDGFAFRRRLASDRVKDLSVEAAWTRWPVEAEQVLVRTSDGETPLDPGGRLPGTGDWEKIWQLRDVENLYDLGMWDNLVDVFCPGYQFRDRETPVAECKGRRRGKKRRK